MLHLFIKTACSSEQNKKNHKHRSLRHIGIEAMFKAEGFSELDFAM